MSDERRAYRPASHEQTWVAGLRMTGVVDNDGHGIGREEERRGIMMTITSRRGFLAGAAALAAAVPTARIAHAQQLGAFDVRTYGAAGDGVKLDTAAINAAIAAAAAAGGGRVFFPAGNYLSHSIRLM